MSDQAYRGIYYDQPQVQAEFERLLQGIYDAEKAREPIAAQHRQAEHAMESGKLSGAEFRTVDDAYIAANNAIAAAQRAVDAFLQANKNYKSR